MKYKSISRRPCERNMEAANT